MKALKKIFSLIAVATALILSVTGCSNEKPTTAPVETENEISVVSREDGSGTRGAFIELFGIEEKGADGTKTDKTTKEAIIANKTDVMITNVSTQDYAIGYVSLGSLSDSVKALKIDGIEATTENVKNGSYKVSRPFNIATKADLSEAAKDFVEYILSKDGQEIVSKSYISSVEAPKDYEAKGIKGKIVVAGSSSVSPLMDKLQEAYKKLNPDVTIELQTSDSTTGMTYASEGTCDIGMASRELKDSEKSAGLTATVIAIDGIAVIVNNNNPKDDLTSEQVKEIFTGSKTLWSDLK